METEEERYFRRKNQNMENWDALGHAFAGSFIFWGIPCLGVMGTLGSLSIWIDLPFLAWIGIGTTLLLAIMGLWSIPELNKW